MKAELGSIERAYADGYAAAMGDKAAAVAWKAIAEVNASDRDKARAEIEPLQAFAAAILQAGPFDGCDVDGATAQELGVKYGVLRQVAYDPAKHGENDCDVQPGEPWYEFTFAHQQQVTEK